MPHQKHVDILEGNKNFLQKSTHYTLCEWHSNVRLLSASYGSDLFSSIGIYRK